MDSTPTEDRGPGSTGPAQTAFDALPTGHRHIIALGAMFAALNTLIGVIAQVGAGTSSGPLHVVNQSIVQVWQCLSVGLLVDTLLLAAILHPARHALALTKSRVLILIVCPAMSIGWVMLFAKYPTSLATSIVGTISQTIPLVFCSVLLWMVARRMTSRVAETWAGVAVMGRLLYLVWSIVAVLGTSVSAFAVPVPERMAVLLGSLLELPLFVASVLVARHAIASINRSDAGATTLP